MLRIRENSKYNKYNVYNEYNEYKKKNRIKNIYIQMF